MPFGLAAGGARRVTCVGTAPSSNTFSSGADIERDWVARTTCWTRVERVLLTHDQVRAYDLPAAAGKAGDPRWAGFARRYGLDPARPMQWEVEALDP